MELPGISPHFNTNINDQSKTDDSIKQDAVNITAGAGSVINTNSGNGRNGGGGLSRWGMSALFQLFAWSLLCDLFVCGFLWMHGNMNKQELDDKIDKVETQIEKITKTTEQAIEESKKATSESKEGTIWILRRDILNSIDFYESKGEVSQKQYKRIKDQFTYYKSIGGNHDVESKMDDFTSKIYGTGEIKMTK